MSNINVTDYLHGPFMLVVTDPNNPLDTTYPLVVAPDGGYTTKEAAIAYVEKHYAKRAVPYLGLQFTVAPIWNEHALVQFCSWED